MKQPLMSMEEMLERCERVESRPEGLFMVFKADELTAEEFADLTDERQLQSRENLNQDYVIKDNQHG